MENTTIKFTLSKKELFWLNILGHIKTLLIVAFISAMLAFIGFLIFVFSRLMPALNAQNYIQNAFLLAVYVITADVIYALLVVIYALIRLAVYSKKDPVMFKERQVLIEKDRAIITYSDNKKDVVKWGQYKINFENNKYLILKSDLNTFIIKKESMQPKDLEWLKNNLKEQNLIEYRKMVEAKRKR
ncbi:MAG TPA: hypothetical protein VIL23_02215 [Clostridia bacterium]